jgi:hypothetical protein
METSRTSEGAYVQLKRTMIALAILGAGFGLYTFLDAYLTSTHLAELPPDYTNTESASFQVFYAPETEQQARRMMKAGEVFLKEFPRRYGDDFGGLEPPTSRIRLTLFRDHEDFTRFARKSLQVDLSNNGGYCDSANQEIVLVLSSLKRDLASLSDESLKLRLPSQEEADVMAIRHELVHYLMERGGGDFGSRAAPWLSEGLACLFEMPDPGDGSPPDLSEWTKLVLSVSRSIPPISQVVGVGSESYRGGENAFAYTFSNLLVRFLWEEDSENLWSYVRIMRNGTKPSWQSFKTHFYYGLRLEERWQKAMLDLRLKAREAIYRAHPEHWKQRPITR